MGDAGEESRQKAKTRGSLLNLACKKFVGLSPRIWLTAIFAAFATITTAISSTVATAVATVSAAAAGTRRTLFTRTGFIDGHGATVHLFAIQGLNRGISAFFGFHGHKSEAARAAAKLVHDEIHFNDIAVSGEEVLELVLSCVEGKISYKQFRIH
jgi:hypothetical protein